MNKRLLLFWACKKHSFFRIAKALLTHIDAQLFYSSGMHGSSGSRGSSTVMLCSSLLCLLLSDTCCDAGGLPSLNLLFRLIPGVALRLQLGYVDSFLALLSTAFRPKLVLLPYNVDKRGDDALAANIVVAGVTAVVPLVEV